MNIIFSDGFECHIPPKQAEWMKVYMNTTKCKPMVECEVYDPYDSPGSVLAESQCIKVYRSNIIIIMQILKV